MPTDLAKVIRYSRNELTSQHVRWIVYQIFKAIKYIHSANVIHRDLKPSNILIDENCHVKICDFGLARVADQHEDGSFIRGPLSEYVQTRWYRAPELLFLSRHYDQAVDMWSIGCILAELLNGNVLFPGTCPLNQIITIIQVIGFPSAEDVKYFADKGAKIQVEPALGQTAAAGVKPLAQLFAGADSNAISLLGGLLTFGPNRRTTIDEALGHPYVAEIRDLANEPVCQRPLDFELVFPGWSQEKLKTLVLDLAAQFQENLGQFNLVTHGQAVTVHNGVQQATEVHRRTELLTEL